MIGKIIKIVPSPKCYGFIESERGEFFFHKKNSENFDQLKLNDSVEFLVDNTGEKVQAVNVKINGKAGVTKMEEGKIVSINTSRGFAHLAVDFLQKSVFLHVTNFIGDDFKKLRVGDELTFEIEQTRKGYNAINASLKETVVVLNDGNA